VCCRVGVVFGVLGVGVFGVFLLLCWLRGGVSVGGCGVGGSCVVFFFGVFVFTWGWCLWGVFLWCGVVLVGGVMFGWGPVQFFFRHLPPPPIRPQNFFILVLGTPLSRLFF